MGWLPRSTHKDLILSFYLLCVGLYHASARRPITMLITSFFVAPIDVRLRQSV